MRKMSWHCSAGDFSSSPVGAVSQRVVQLVRAKLGQAHRFGAED
jgi:hypothetical protein